MINYLIPFERIGDFEIEGNLSDYKQNFNFEYTPADDTTGWETYELIDDGISLYVENNKIKSIACDDECLYKGRNIIGLNIEEFINFSELTPEEEIDECFLDEDIVQSVYEFDDIGLQIWCENDIIVTVIASAFIDEDEKE